MRFLPIVDRELREGSRRRGTYWLRVRVAIQAILIGLAAYVINLIEPLAKLGLLLFWGLAGVSMLFCLLAGRRATADCLSQEKREGTLGLLFLTDLKGYDVVLGKLVATSIANFYALVTVFPVLAIPLLAGGMTNGEFWRMVLVLVNTFFVSLAIGMAASSCSREYRAAMAGNFLLALLLLAGPAAGGLAVLASPTHRFVPPLFYGCPIFSFILCNDIQYVKMPGDFWWSLGVTHALAWLLILAACWIVPRTWGDKPAPAPSRRWRWRDLGRMIGYGSPAKCAEFRRQALDINAYYWLSGRVRLKPAHVWWFLGIAAGWWIYGRSRAGAYWFRQETYVAAAVIVNSAFKLWIIQEAVQRIGEDRRSGAFELLLATPLTVDDFLRGQWLALRRQFLKPLILVTALEAAFVISLARNWHFLVPEVFTYTAGIGMLWADVVALPWVAMAAALICKNQTRATSFTVARILILPWVAYGCIAACVGFIELMDLVHWNPGFGYALGLWFGLGLSVDLFFGWRARLLLHRDFRRLAAQSFLPEPARSPLWDFCRSAATWARRCAARGLPPRARKPILVGLVGGVALSAVFLARLSRPHYPPPVLVSITQSNAPFQVFPAGDNGVLFVMPDATLWRWGKTGAPQSPRAVVPEQIGAAHDWVKAVGAGTHCLGLRADGTIWGWGFSNGGLAPEPQLAVQGHDWVDVGTGQHLGAGVKSDGTLWTWNEPLAANGGHPTALTKKSGNNWVAVCCGKETAFVLRKDGAMAVEGIMTGRGGRRSSMQFLWESNWTSLAAGGFARNQLGELWYLEDPLINPRPGLPVAHRLVSSDWLGDRVFSTTYGTRAQARSDGTLWVAPVQTGAVSGALVEPWRRLGTRSDWVAVWGEAQTGYGMTADGTVWTWGVQLEKEPGKTYGSRLELLRDRLTGRPAWSPGPLPRAQPASYALQPRPLLKLVGPSPKQNGK